MNKLFFILITFCIFAPNFTLALDYSDCDTGTAQCSCTPDDKTGFDQTGVDSIEKCQEACRMIEPFQDAFGGTVTGFSVQCSIDGTITTLSQGGLDTPIDYDSSVVGVTDPYQDVYATPNLGVEIPGLEFTPAVKSEGSVTSNYLGEYIQAVMKFVFPGASLLAVIFIMIGGLQYIMTRGKPDSIGKAKTKIRNGVVGVVLLFCAFTIAQVVDPNFLTLKGLTATYIKTEFVSTEDTYSDIASLNLSQPRSTQSDIPSEGTNGVTYYTQRENDTPYGACGTVATSGCGVTSTAMVLTHLGYTITPSELAILWGAQGSCPQSTDYGTSCRACPLSGGCSCMGTRWESFTSSNVIQDNGFIGTQITTEEQIISYLKNNQPIIASMGPGIFTSSGHFIVLTGVDESGNILVNDPNSGIQSASYNDVFGALKGAWYIRKN